MRQDYAFKVGGEAGQGLQTIGTVLAKALARQGLHIFTNEDYFSRVRGGHNFTQVRAASYPVWSYRDELDVLVALDTKSIDLHGREMAPGGVIIYDSEVVKNGEGLSNSLAIPLSKIGKEYGGKKVMGNAAALGAIWELVGGDLQVLEGTLTDLFADKGDEIVELNIKTARGGASYTRENFQGECRCKLEKLPYTPRLVISGNEAAALGAMASGCQFISAYPMSPASSVFVNMSRQTHRLPLVFEQAEDEIAAIHMAMGAAYTGVRSMVATSGGGFALMVEGLSLAGCTETPLVVFIGQRPGPATGLATRTEQSDLLFCLNAGHGEFPRAILAPGSAEEAFWLTVEAFNLADKYQSPVFILSDQLLADATYTVEPFDLSRVEIDRGEVLDTEDREGVRTYKRHRFTPSGISPRAFPGLLEQVVVTSGNEHTEEGYPTEDAVIRAGMVEKRLRKAIPLKEEMAPPKKYGPENPDITLLTWGSSWGACREAADALNSKGKKVGVVHMTHLWPFPAEHVVKALEGAGRLVTVEMNATGQLGRLLRQETGIKPDGAVLKYDGRPMNGAYVANKLAEGGEQPW